MSYLLPHVHSRWAVDRAILAEEECLVRKRFWAPKNSPNWVHCLQFLTQHNVVDWFSYLQPLTRVHRRRRHDFHHRHQQLGFESGLEFGFRYSKTVQLSPFPRRPSSFVANSEKNSNTTSCSSSGLDFGLPLAACIQAKFPHDNIPVLRN